MALFGIFGKKEAKNSPRKGFHQLRVTALHRLTDESVKISFEVSEDLKKSFSYEPGQHLDIVIPLNGKEEHRSYSICSGKNEPLSIGVKALKDGLVSRFLNEEIKEGDYITVSEPRGHFTIDEKAGNVILIAAGSGITPVLSMAKFAGATNKKVKLIYGNRTESSIMFKEEIAALSSVDCTFFLSGESKEGFRSGRLDKENFTTLIKEDLDLLKSDAFYLCGPEGMIIDVRSTLEFFGVKSEKIHFELFTAPVEMESTSTQTVASFAGVSHVEAILDGEKITFDLDAKGPTLLEGADKAGMDAPYSCKGGVCCSCRAKVLKGSAMMKVNYALTDEEVSQGYILTCQAHPTSSELTFSYDD
jgi:ring-1,2-phenylacetyl-CoA epoxidase subunit PaaE